MPGAHRQSRHRNRLASVSELATASANAVGLLTVWSIVHVLSSFGVGGQERVALDRAIGQKARGHRVSVVSLAPPPDGAMADEFREHGITVDRVPKRGGLDASLVPRLV